MRGGRGCGVSFVNFLIDMYFYILPLICYDGGALILTVPICTYIVHTFVKCGTVISSALCPLSSAHFSI
jgi:hypothetical protein